LRTALKDAGYRALEAPGVLEANALLAYEPDLSLIIADTRLGDQLWEMADTLSAEMPTVPLVAISVQARDEAAGRAHNVRAFLRQPFQEQQFLAFVTQFAPTPE
jgi:CheY-like chemotaxis protein